MEDSKILWYIVLGAIYFLSKAFGKKKKKPEPQQTYEQEQEYVPEEVPKKPKSTSFDDILKELTKEAGFEEEQPKKPEPVPVVEEPKTLVSETAPLPSYEPKAEIAPSVDRAKSNPNERPEYKRSTNFEIIEEKNQIAEDIHKQLSEMDGPKKAIILSEILNRKY